MNPIQLACAASGQPTEASRAATWWISSGLGSLAMTLLNRLADLLVGHACRSRLP